MEFVRLFVCKKIRWTRGIMFVPLFIPVTFGSVGILLNLVWI